MYAECNIAGESIHIDEDECYKCEEFACEQHPDHEKRKKREQISKLKSSDFGKDIIKRASSLFDLTEEEADRHLEISFVNMQASCDLAVKALVKDAFAYHATKYVDKKLKEALDALLAQAIEKKIMVLQKDDTPILTTIQERAEHKIKDYINKQTNRQHGHMSDPLEKLVGNLVDEKVGEAVEEIKKETIDKFNKDVMKKMMGGMAKAIQDDKRLLAAISE